MAEEKCPCGMPLDKAEDKCNCKESTCHYCCQCPPECSCGCKKKAE